MANLASKPTRGRLREHRIETRVQEAAGRAIEEHEQLELSARDSEAFVEALLRPKPVNSRLSETVRRYREATGV